MCNAHAFQNVTNVIQIVTLLNFERQEQSITILQKLDNLFHFYSLVLLNLLPFGHRENCLEESVQGNGILLKTLFPENAPVQ